MSCIVAIKTDTEIIVGADNLLTSSAEKWNVNKIKLFQKDGVIFGISGSLLLSNLLRHSFSVPKFTFEQTTDDFVYNTFTNSLRELLIDNNMIDKEHEIKKGQNFGLLLVVKDKIYVCEDLCIFENGLNYMATSV